MSKKLTAVIVVCVVALVMGVLQQVARTAPALTALDYAEIHQLYARYAVGVDTMANDGEMFARVFTEDGVFNSHRGYEQLKAFANALKKRRAENGLDSTTPIHYLGNILLEPTAEGAMGVAYHLGMAGDTPDKGVYHDQLVKTPEGWRFKKRMFTPGAFGDELLQALAQ